MAKYRPNDRVEVRMEPEMFAWVGKMATTMGIGMSELIRRAIRRYQIQSEAAD